MSDEEVDFDAGAEATLAASEIVKCEDVEAEPSVAVLPFTNMSPSIENLRRWAEKIGQKFLHGVSLYRAFDCWGVYQRKLQSGQGGCGRMLASGRCLPKKREQQ